MPLYICHFCNYSSNNKYVFYYHNNKHLTSDNINSFTPEEIQLCKFYKEKKLQNAKKYL